MSINVKAMERDISFQKDQTKYAYVMTTTLYNTLKADKVIKEAALRSGVNQGVMQACWDAAGEVIKAWATEGHNVPIPGLGSMRFSVRARSVEDVNDVKTSLIKTRRVIFTPSQEVKNELAATSISITCFDRNGQLVKRVLSSDTGDVEDPEGGDNGGSPSTGSGTSGSENNGSQNNGSSSSSGSSGSSSVAAPTISGTTPFDDSTQVTISGPAGATIKYTTNGVAPTATYGNDYEEPITLNASATVKAVAIIDGVASEVATKAFVKNGSQGGSGEEGM
ncbi:MAG: chitobiase/beta-hexosaminidase C-terminal domain-containing protein [Bacteroidaceae bacterium]|nr:chitobiase/beta-hexosaminidase C-terminal domain-containing protein [Bacteroidaceae bacterium]